MDEPLPDIPRLYTGIAEWGACITYVFLITRAKLFSRTALIAPASLAALIAFQFLADALPVGLWIPGMLGAFCLMAASIHLLSRLDLVSTWHLTFRAFILAEFIASLQWQLSVFFTSRRDIYSFPMLTIMLCSFALLLTVWALLERRNITHDEPLALDKSDLWIGFFITVVTFSMSNLSFVSTSTPFSGRLGPEIFYIRTLVDLCGLAALYAQNERIIQMRTTAELTSIHAMLDAQHNQYLQSKADFEAIGRAHHDLKHQFVLLRSEIDPESRDATFEELERSISDLGTQFHSGNPVLDVILRSKASVCIASDIEFTAVADGKLLSAMSSMDIATLFGNALDNAIEASQKVADRSRRIIKVALHQMGEMVVIRVENWYQGALSIDAAGNLLTRKPDRARHGFGVKSIRWTAKKYGGEVTTSTDGQWFTLTVLLPNTTPVGNDAKRPVN